MSTVHFSLSPVHFSLHTVYFKCLLSIVHCLLSIVILFPIIARADILKVDFFAEKKQLQNHTKNHIICVNNKETTEKEIKIHKFLVCAYKSQDIA